MSQKEILEVEGKGVSVPGNEIDTDQIIPARFMKCVTFDGLGEYAFYDVRFDQDGNEKKHPFNDEKYKDSSVLLVNKNFGCGSSREHAPQALQKFGIEAIIGETYAEIFAGNCTAMGIPAVKVTHDQVEELMALNQNSPETPITLDIRGKKILAGDKVYPFDMPEPFRQALIAGTWDSTSSLLLHLDDIKVCEKGLPYLTNFTT